MKRVLFIDSVHPILDEMLTANGYICHHDYRSSYAEICDKLKNYVGVVIRSRLPVDRDFLKSGTHLCFIARSGSGLENIDLAAANELHIAIISSPEGNRDAVGEHAIGMLLSLFNKINQADDQVRRGVWDRDGNRGIELTGKTVGIIGYGQMGSSFAKKLSGFDCTILAHDKYKSGFGNEFINEVSLVELQRRADVISIHLPLSAETDYYINSSFIAACAKPFYLINTSRGRQVETESLVIALRNGKVLGACLDVLEYEMKSLEKLDLQSLPSAYQALIGSEKVVLSPHVAGWTVESYVKLSKVLGDKILALKA